MKPLVARPSCRRAAIGAVLSGLSFMTSAEARETSKRHPRGRDADIDLQNLSALVEAQQIEIGKLRQALGLNSTDGQSAKLPPRSPHLG
jgi:hypothetical protein